LERDYRRRRCLEAIQGVILEVILAAILAVTLGAIRGTGLAQPTETAIHTNQADHQVDKFRFRDGYRISTRANSLILRSFAKKAISNTAVFEAPTLCEFQPTGGEQRIEERRKQYPRRTPTITHTHTREIPCSRKWARELLLHINSATADLDFHFVPLFHDYSANFFLPPLHFFLVISETAYHKNYLYF
jgi:hypothetical protein